MHWARFYSAIIAVAVLAGTAAAQVAIGDPSESRIGPPLGMDGRNRAAGNLTLNGNVQDDRHQPVKDARVELRSIRNEEPVASTYTNGAGQFEFENLPMGMYEVVVSHGLAQDRQQVNVDGAGASAVFRLAESEADGKAGNNSTVSVAEMKVPKKAHKHFEKAAELLKKREFDKAAQEADAALAIYPKFAQALTIRGVLKLDKGQTQDAIADFQSAIDSDPNYPLAYVAMGSAYNALGQYADAARVLDRAQELNPRSWQAHFEMAKADLGRQDLDSALREANRASEMAPENYAPLYLIRAHIYLTQKNYSDAMTELEKYLQKAPGDAHAAEARKTLDQVRAFAASHH